MAHIGLNECLPPISGEGGAGDGPLELPEQTSHTRKFGVLAVEDFGEGTGTPVVVDVLQLCGDLLRSEAPRKVRQLLRKPRRSGPEHQRVNKVGVRRGKEYAVGAAFS